MQILYCLNPDFFNRDEFIESGLNANRILEKSYSALDFFSLFYQEKREEVNRIQFKLSPQILKQVQDDIHPTKNIFTKQRVSPKTLSKDIWLKKLTAIFLTPSFNL